MHADRAATQARQFIRQQTLRAARIEPVPEHADQFRLSLPDAQSEVSVTDVSRGGVGLNASIFIPRNLRVILHVRSAEDPAGAPARDLSVRLVCRRCTLTDHKPTYLVGFQYVDAAGPDELAFIASIGGGTCADAPAPPGGTV